MILGRRCVIYEPRIRVCVLIDEPISDGVLNPSGVRFGSAEIYTVMERFSDVVDDSRLQDIMGALCCRIVSLLACSYVNDAL